MARGTKKKVKREHGDPTMARICKRPDCEPCAAERRRSRSLQTKFSVAVDEGLHSEHLYPHPLFLTCERCR